MSAEPHLVATLAEAIEAAVPEHLIGDDSGYVPEIDATSAREAARDILERLRLAGFDVVRVPA